MARTAINNLLAENLRHYMAANGITTQTDLAKKVGVVQRTIGYYLDPKQRQPSKSGKPPSAKLAEVEALASALGVEVWQLLMPAETREHYARLEALLGVVKEAVRSEATGNAGERAGAQHRKLKAA